MNSPSEIRHTARRRRDSFVRILVSAFGGLVLLTLVVLIAHLISQAIPLAYTPSVENGKPFNIDPQHRMLASGDVMAGQTLIASNGPCRLVLYSMVKQALQPYRDYVRPCTHELGSVSLLGQNYITDVSPSGQVRVIEERALQTLPTAQSAIVPVPSENSVSLQEQVLVTFAVPESRWQSRVSWRLLLSDKWAVMQIESHDDIFVRWVNIGRPTRRIDQIFTSEFKVLPLPGTQQTLLTQGTSLTVADLQTGQRTSFELDKPVTWWQSLPKDRTVLVADNEGGVTRWVLQNQAGQLIYAPTYHIRLEKGETPTVAVPQASSNALAVLTSQRRLLLLNRISGEVVTSQELPVQNTGVAWFGKRLYTFNEQNLTVWEIHNLSGITTWSSLFESQVYEGYRQPQTLWQTTSASDYQEAKYSILPLLMGSIKASLMALVIAIPMSLGAAVYTAYFANTGIRQALKPTIEMLEAIPSVLIGFIAAIWLAPLAEPFLFSFAVFLFVVPLALLVLALFQHRIARKIPLKWRHGSELVFTVLGIMVLGYISFFWAPGWFFALFGVEDFEHLSTAFGSPTGKNTLVVAIALGVAISPSIYSLTEDAISGVPKDLKLASFALGATRLQTLHHIVLKVALPGILAAIMLGFGRAFGETMIVLMVTGNTPIASWDLFEGLRALTANLAIELPEADVGSIHYQILFFTACLLFAFTFVLNTCAELLRQRLRSRTRYV